MQPLEEETSRLGGLHVQSLCCRRTLGQVKKQTGGTEGGEKGRDKFTEAAAVQGWLCNWPRDWAQKGPGFSSSGSSGEEMGGTAYSRVERGFRKWTDLETAISKRSKSDREAETSYDIFFYVESEKTQYKRTNLENRN